MASFILVHFQENQVLPLLRDRTGHRGEKPPNKNLNLTTNGCAIFKWLGHSLIKGENENKIRFNNGVFVHPCSRLQFFESTITGSDSYQS
jgi:hypothetical protein